MKGIWKQCISLPTTQVLRIRRDVWSYIKTADPRISHKTLLPTQLGPFFGKVLKAL